jgi:hypothetical protein
VVSGREAAEQRLLNQFDLLGGAAPCPHSLFVGRCCHPPLRHEDDTRPACHLPLDALLHFLNSSRGVGVRLPQLQRSVARSPAAADAWPLSRQGTASASGLGSRRAGRWAVLLSISQAIPSSL